MVSTVRCLHCLTTTVANASSRIDETFLPGHAAAIHLRLDGKEQVIGVFGILHPTVLDKFELRYPVSTLEMNIEVFL